MFIAEASQRKRVYPRPLTLEPPNMRGLLFLQDNDKVEVLKFSGESNPDSPPDIPERAVTEDGIFISVDGIGQDWKRHTEQINDWYLGGAEFGVTLPGPVVGIHEGEGKSGLHDGARILRNTLLTKALQCGKSDRNRIEKWAFDNDPAVKTISDQLRQSLRVGRQLTFMAHSGGGSQVALALSLLATDPDPQWKSLISSGVRILGTAPAAHRRDFEWAGVSPENVMITGSRRDPVYRFYSNFLDTQKPLSGLSFLIDGVKATSKFVSSPGPYHSGEYIFGHQQNVDGHKIETFLRGGPGRDSILP